MDFAEQVPDEKKNETTPATTPAIEEASNNSQPSGGTTEVKIIEVEKQAQPEMPPQRVRSTLLWFLLAGVLLFAVFMMVLG